MYDFANKTKVFLRNRNSMESDERQIAAKTFSEMLEYALSPDGKTILNETKVLFSSLGFFALNQEETYDDYQVTEGKNLSIDIEQRELDTKKRALVLLAQSHNPSVRNFFIDSFIKIYEEAETTKDVRKGHNARVLNNMSLVYHELIHLLETHDKYAEETAKIMVPAMHKSKSKPLQKLSKEISFHLSKLK